MTAGKILNSMKTHPLYRLAVLSAVLVVGACSSKKKEAKWEPPKTVEQSPTDWDYNQIRQSREAERIDSANNNAESQDAEMQDCTFVSRSEMIRSKRQGCRPADPRSGQGADSFCCPR